MLKLHCSMIVLVASLQWIMMSSIQLDYLPRLTQSCYLCSFTPAVVKKYIKHLRNNASPRPDWVPAEFYKGTSSFVSFPLSVIFNISIQTGELPSIWKNACITPVFKKGTPVTPEITYLYHLHALLVN